MPAKGFRPPFVYDPQTQGLLRAERWFWSTRGAAWAKGGIAATAAAGKQGARGHCELTLGLIPSMPFST